MSTFFLKLSKVALAFAIDEALKNALPRIYQKLDAQMPQLMFNNAPPSLVKATIQQTIASETGKPSTPEKVAAVIALYDPIKAATRTFLVK